MAIKVGDRVISRDGEIGYVEEITNGLADVRCLTPNNKPSCCVGSFWIENLRVVGDHVVPMQKSAEWWQEAREFHQVIEDALQKV